MVPSAIKSSQDIGSFESSIVGHANLPLLGYGCPKEDPQRDKKTSEKLFVGGRDEKNKWALVNWDMVCTPKLNGGLGLRDPKTNNDIMGAKIWWRWIKHEKEPRAKIWS